MTERRRYTKREKAEAVVAAAATSTLAAAQARGMNESTIRSWLQKPEYANLRDKTSGEIADDSLALAYLAQSELARKVQAGDVEPRDLAVIYGIAIDKAQLLAGHATERVESKDITDVFDDHETRAIVEGARQYLEGAGSEQGPAVAQEAAVEDAGA